jgi:hypothetical protein
MLRPLGHCGHSLQVELDYKAEASGAELADDDVMDETSFYGDSAEGGRLSRSAFAN